MAPQASIPAFGYRPEKFKPIWSNLTPLWDCGLGRSHHGLELPISLSPIPRQRLRMYFSKTILEQPGHPWMLNRTKPLQLSPCSFVGAWQCVCSVTSYLELASSPEGPLLLLHCLPQLREQSARLSILSMHFAFVDLTLHFIFIYCRAVENAVLGLEPGWASEAVATSGPDSHAFSFETDSQVT